MANKAFIDIIFNKEGALKSLSDFHKKIDNTFSAIQNSTTAKMAGVLGAITGGLSIKKVYDEARRIGNFSDMFNVDVSKVSVFANTLSKFGGNSETAVNGLKTIQQAIVDLRTTASGPLKTVGAQIGLNLYDQFGNLKDSVGVMDELREKFKLLESDAAKAKIAQELGLGDPAFLRMLKSTDAEYANIREEASKYGVLTKDNWATVRRFDQSLASLNQSFLALGVALIGKVEPAIKLIADGFDWLARSEDWVKEIVVWGGIATTALWPVVSVIKGIGGALKAVGALAVGHPVIALLVALGAGAAYAYNKWKPVRDFFSEFLGMLKDGFSWVAEKIQPLVELSKDLANAFNSLNPFSQKETQEERKNRARAELKEMGLIDAPDISKILPPVGVIPTQAERSIVNNNQKSSVFNSDNQTTNNNVNNYYNLSFPSINSSMGLQSALAGFVQQNAGGVRR